MVYDGVAPAIRLSSIAVPSSKAKYLTPLIIIVSFDGPSVSYAGLDRLKEVWKALEGIRRR